MIKLKILMLPANPKVEFVILSKCLPVPLIFELSHKLFSQNLKNQTLFYEIQASWVCLFF